MSPTTDSIDAKGTVRDAEIVALYLARDERAILETQRRYGRASMNLSMEILQSRPDAEECVSDSYLKTWNSIPPARPQSLGAYLLRIVRNLSLNRLRDLTAARRNRDLTVSIEELDACLPDNCTETTDLTDALSRFLGTLSERDRRLFLGRYWYNVSVKSLAASWGMTPNAVTQNLAKTRGRLRTFLENGGISL